MPDPSDLSSLDQEALLQQLRRKEGSWLEWAVACQKLQKAGLNPQAIFEGTGFEPIQQNQIIVGWQVYEGLSREGASAAVLGHFGLRASDILYELRILDPQERVRVAELALLKGLDVEEVHEVVRATKVFSLLPQVPEGFTSHPGDAIAHQAWRLARQTENLQERSRLIARALRFVQSDSARQLVEKLLTDFSVQPRRSAPLLPSYRIEEESELPRVIPVAGEWPLTRHDLQAVPYAQPQVAFRMVKTEGVGAWLALPGWPPIVAAVDPVAILWDPTQMSMLDAKMRQPGEQVVVLVDRADREWQAQSYFLVEQAGSLAIQWFEDEPEERLLAKVLIVVRPPRIFDTEATQEHWQLEDE
ncbi:MAG: hypothetical protein HC924_08790 [Synechococcaceae cyanobacterium SM2_3_2]|nr:hypothetical protein [Synechococcaceae cyanobacterium SM2_3_2]